MAAIFAYRCHCCDKLVEGSPSVAFKRPDPWLQQPEHVRAAGGANDDFCFYTDEDGPHYFIRTVMEIPIVGIEEPYLWGVWVSLSEKSYRRYRDTFDNADTSDAWFGYLCNMLPGYPPTHSLSFTVRPQDDNERPLIEPHETTHPLFADFRDGITVARAQELAQYISAH